MIWIVFGAIAVATFLSVGKVLAEADPGGSRAPIRFLSFIFWIVGLLLAFSGKPLVGLCVMAVGAFGLGAVSGAAPPRSTRTRGRSAFGERDRGGGPTSWRENFDRYANARAGEERVRARPGVMTEEEAYQILGLQPGASAQEVVRAHRALMKKVHPDQGGSTEIAARVNAAKDFLAARGHG